MASSNYILNFTDRKRKSIIVKYIRNRILKENRNFLGIIEGETGSGKSWAGMRLCEEVDDFFNSDRIVFNVNDFTQLMTQDFPKGSTFLFEEAGVGIHNLNFWSQENRAFNYIAQTFRHKNYCVFLTLPYSLTLDSQIKRYFHAIFRATGKINLKEKKALFEVHFPKPHMYKKDKTLNFKLNYVSQDGFKKITGAWVKKPTNQLIKAYDLKKVGYTMELNKKIALGLSMKKKRKNDL